PAAPSPGSSPGPSPQELSGEPPARLLAAVRAKEAALAELGRAQAALEAAAGRPLARLLRAGLGARGERLRALLLRCRERNTRNGGLIASGRQRVEAALAVLRAAVPAPCYTPEGGTAPAGAGSRSLGRV
ncbi:MAG: hypothetical protein D6809_04690, partial [Gammaproteobacteria bacterium]